MKDSILIVDDSTFIVEGLVALLKKTYNPIPTYGGEECLELLRTVTPSLIILDIMMEPMDGWETLSRIKENPKTRHIPVLMFSAKKISPAEAESHRIIMDDFITKPVNPRSLMEAIDKVLKRQEFNRETIRAWNAACVSPEFIDEYLTVKTNLDVDASLLAVMKKQLGTAVPDAANRDELVRSVAVLEERIATSRSRIESFCHEHAGILPTPRSGDLTGESPRREPGPLPGPAGNSPDPRPARTFVPLDPVPPREETPAPAELVQPAPGPASLEVPAPEEVPQPAPVSPVRPDENSRGAEEPLILPVHPRIPDRSTRSSPGTESVILPGPAGYPAGSGEASREPASGTPARAGPPMEVVEGENPVDRSPAKPLFRPYTQPVQSGSPRSPEPGSDDAIPGRVSLTYTPSNRGPSPAPLVGSGTQTPRMQSRSAARREPAPGNRPGQGSQKPAPAQSGGIIARIIGAIAALFGKKT